VVRCTSSRGSSGVGSGQNGDGNPPGHNTSTFYSTRTPNASRTDLSKHGESSVTRKMSGKGNNSLLYPVPDSDDTYRVGEKDTGVVRMKLWVRLGVGTRMRRMEKESRM